MWGMRGRSRVRRHHFGLETAGRNARPPSPCQTPRRCRLSHGNMDIHIPSVCLQVLSYRDRPRLHSLVHGYRLRLGSRCVPVRFAFFGEARWWFHCCVFRAYLVEVFCSSLQLGKNHQGSAARAVALYVPWKLFLPSFPCTGLEE